MAKDKDLTPEFTDLITSGAAVEQPQAEQPEQPEKAEKKPKEKKQPYRTVSVGLRGDELAEIERIAQELEQPRHAVLKYAIGEFIRRYNEGERPELVTVLKLK